MRLRYDDPATTPQVFDPTGTGESAVLGSDAALMYAAEPPVADAAPLAQVLLILTWRSHCNHGVVR